MSATTLKADRYFFTGIGIYYFLVCLIGFGYTSYNYEPLNEWFPAIVIHGVLSSIWITLFLVQATLISVGHRKLHARLGMLGLLTVLLMIPSSIYLILFRVQIGAKTIDFGGMELSALFYVYAVFLIGIGFRKKAHIHKRMLLLGTMLLISTGINRLVGNVLKVELSSWIRVIILFLPAILLLIHDFRTRRKVFLVTVLIPLLIFPLTIVLGTFWSSSAGESFMRKMISIKEVKIENPALVGDALKGGWENVLPMKIADTKEEIFETELELIAGELRVLNNHTYTLSWGGSGFPEGKLSPTPANIRVPEGKYLFRINARDKSYSFLLIEE
ncbi:MAG: hypothetical protein AAGD28_19975 [Bacteroidota bacterium]